MLSPEVSVMILGNFHIAMSDFEHEFHAERTGIHDTSRHIQHLRETLADKSFQDHDNFEAVSEVAAQILEMTDKLEKLPEQDPQIVHGDPKISNILFDCDSDKPIALIDFDTLQPGLLYNDFSDCIRSSCNPLGEEVKDSSEIYFDIQYFECFLQGYFSKAKHCLKQSDFVYLSESIRLIPIELSIRFLTDYLLGNKYFHTNYDNQNLFRSEVQLALLHSIELQIRLPHSEQ